MQAVFGDEQDVDKDGDKMFAEMDFNGDGKVSLSEYAANNNGVARTLSDAEENVRAAPAGGGAGGAGAAGAAAATGC